MRAHYTALALMLASKQWNDTAYLGAARRLVDLIYLREVDGDGYLMPGDGWNSDKNPSYQSTMAMRLFDSLPGQNGRWKPVVEKAYGMLLRNLSQSPVTGLPSDWCDTSGMPTKGTAEAAGNFGYESVRTPWRMAMAYAWFGDTAAKRVAGNIAAFANDSRFSIAGKLSNLLDGYKVSDGSLFHYADYPPAFSAAFVGPMGIAGLVDEKYRPWVDSCYDTLPTTATGGWYYDKILQVLSGIVLSGNFTNLWPGATSTGIGQASGKEGSLALRTLRQGGRLSVSLEGQALAWGQILSASGRRVRRLERSGGRLVTDLRGLPVGAYWIRAAGADGHVRTATLPLP